MLRWYLIAGEIGLPNIKQRLVDQINFSRHFTAALSLIRKNKDLPLLKEEREIRREIQQINQWRLENQV